MFLVITMQCHKPDIGLNEFVIHCVFQKECDSPPLLQWDVGHSATFPLATMSVVFTFIFVLEVSLWCIACGVCALFFKHDFHLCAWTSNWCRFPGNHEADSHVPSWLLAEQAESLRPAGHVAWCHLDCPALLTAGQWDFKFVAVVALAQRDPSLNSFNVFLFSVRTRTPTWWGRAWSSSGSSPYVESMWGHPFPSFLFS